MFDFSIIALAFLGIMVLMIIGSFIFDILEDFVDIVSEYWFIIFPGLAFCGLWYFIGLQWAITIAIIILVAAIVLFLLISKRDTELNLKKHNRKKSEDKSAESTTDVEENDIPETNTPSKSKNSMQVSCKPDVTFEDIKGLDEAKEAFKMRVLYPLQHKDIYEKYDKKTGGGILLYGLPGTGKTMFAKAVANEIDAAYFEVKCSDIMSKWYGESEGKIKKLFKDARKNPRAVIFFDEFEAIGRKRNSNDGTDLNIVPELLAQIQGFKESKNMLLILAATNRPWDIDSALLRPGRFNEKLLIPLPDLAARKAIVEGKLKKVPIEDSVSFDYIAEITEGFNGADVVEFCEALKNYPIVRSIENNTTDEKITMDDVEKTKSKIKSSVSAEDIEALEEFEENNCRMP